MKEAAQTNLGFTLPSFPRSAYHVCICCCQWNYFCHDISCISVNSFCRLRFNSLGSSRSVWILIDWASFPISLSFQAVQCFHTTRFLLTKACSLFAQIRICILHEPVGFVFDHKRAGFVFDGHVCVGSCSTLIFICSVSLRLTGWSSIAAPHFSGVRFSGGA